MKGDAFTRDKFAWLDQVAGDHAAGLLAFRLAYEITRYLNRQTGEAYPGQNRLAEGCGVTKTGARNAIARLVDRGHLKVTPGSGKGITSRYSIIIKTPERCNDEDTLEGGKVQPLLHDTPAKGATAVAERCNDRFLKGATGVATNPLKEPIEEPIEGKAPLTPHLFFRAKKQERGRQSHSKNRHPQSLAALAMGSGGMEQDADTESDIIDITPEGQQ